MRTEIQGLLQKYPVRGKPVAGQLCGDYPVARRVAAMQRFRVRAEVLDQTRRAGRGNTQRVGGLRDVKPK